MLSLALSNKKNRIELLREFESILKTALAHESGGPGVPFNEKTKGRKSRETVPLIISIVFLVSNSNMQALPRSVTLPNFGSMDLQITESFYNTSKVITKEAKFWAKFAKFRTHPN
jgi:hypothetical protein